MAGQFGLRFRLPRKSQGSFTCRKSATWDRRLYFPSEGTHAEDFSFALGPFGSSVHLQRRSMPYSMKDLCERKEEVWVRNGRPNFVRQSDFHVNHRVLLYAANLRHGTDGFTSPPKEGMLWIFLPEKFDGFGRVRTRDLWCQRPEIGRASCRERV
jgi:hypothetical protein